MARRKTIGRDPLADLSYELDAAAVVAATASAAEMPPLPGDDAIPLASEAGPLAEGAERGAVGGKLEILGGNLGSGTRIIWRFGPSARVGFIAPTGRLVDLGAELESILAWPDRTDHRMTSAAGWAWVLASLVGVVGLVAGGGLRLLVPHRMMARLRLRDGGEFLVRTDNVTITALEAVARARALHRAASVPA